SGIQMGTQKFTKNSNRMTFKGPKQIRAVGREIDGAELVESSAIAARYTEYTGPGSFIERRGLAPIREQGMHLIGFRRNSRQAPETDARTDV
ncbi:unnamed protein product, partial [Heterotrigona itama]